YYSNELLMKNNLVRSNRTNRKLWQSSAKSESEKNHKRPTKKRERVTQLNLTDLKDFDDLEGHVPETELLIRVHQTWRTHGVNFTGARQWKTTRPPGIFLTPVESRKPECGANVKNLEQIIDGNRNYSSLK
ncbi:hypothetical protein RUM43_011193, partial [Polyplax serrata]